MFYTCESVSIGHPDKLADQISDAVVDACLAQDIDSKVACETLITKGLVFIAGEITTRAQFSYDEIAKQVLCNSGYEESVKVITAVHTQSNELLQAVNKGASDQSILYGYASDE